MSTGPGADSLPRELEDLVDELGWQEEGLFVRDLDGRLIRYDAPTREEFDKVVELMIDGHTIKVRKAVPATDEMGNPRHDEDGRAIPRATTVYDAVSQLYENLDRAGLSEGKEASQSQATPAPATESDHDEAFKRAPGDSSNPIPILCHMKYMEPVAVCRLCVVQIARFRRRTGKTEVDDKLLPSCQHRVEEGMIVDTIASPSNQAAKRIDRAVKSLLALLMADHPTPCAKERQIPGDCELEALAKRFGIDHSPFEPRPAALPTDGTSLVIAVDHNACILCDRCIRGCDVIKENHVLGRMGKGYSSRIAFDLGVAMGYSSCVACGECMVSCPTGALTFTSAIDADWYEEEAGSRRGHAQRRTDWLSWLTFGLFRRQARPLQRARPGESSIQDGARAQ
jgi:ferredoxin